ncbi:MAG: response regulator [Pyrinomonadaceae bacterium]
MSAPPNTFEKNVTLLVVDQDASVGRSLQLTFQTEGYRVVTATDAPAALRLLHQERCDLIILDVEMPGVSGLALCRILRAQTTTKQIPVVVYSTRDDEACKVEAFAAGVDDFIVKPSTPGELLSRVGAHLESALRERALIRSNRELSFLADLGRGLLHALEPDQVARRMAGMTFEGASGALCAAALFPETHEKDPVVSVFDREGTAEGPDQLYVARLRKWLDSPASAVSVLLKERKSFLLRDKTHRVEYVAPLRFGGRSLGALIVAFDHPEECSATESRLIDAAAQLAALAAHISSLYANLSQEVGRRTAEAESERRFTEAIIDSLPISLHAVDREYRIVAWNRNREVGKLGIPRVDALGRNIFDVLTKQPRGLLEREFARVFATGHIERIEQETRSGDGDTQNWLISKIPMRAGEPRRDARHHRGRRRHGARAQPRRRPRGEIGRRGSLGRRRGAEINNPLATIATCAEALESRLDKGTLKTEDLREYLGLIRSGAFRCKRITNGLLDFSRARGERVPVDVVAMLYSVARLLSHQSAESASIFALTPKA